MDTIRTALEDNNPAVLLSLDKNYIEELYEFTHPILTDEEKEVKQQALLQLLRCAALSTWDTWVASSSSLAFDIYEPLREEQEAKVLDFGWKELMVLDTIAVLHHGDEELIFDLH
jgi:hypothetical protein